MRANNTPRKRQEGIFMEQGRRVMRDVSFIKLEIFIPETHLPALQEALRSADAGHIGKYDSCLSFHHVTGTWRALEGAVPYHGAVGELMCEQEIKVEVTIKAQRLRETIAAIKQVHPYEEPVINAIPLIGTGLDDGL